MEKGRQGEWTVSRQCGRGRRSGGRKEGHGTNADTNEKNQKRIKASVSSPQFKKKKNVLNSLLRKKKTVNQSSKMIWFKSRSCCFLAGWRSPFNQMLRCVSACFSCLKGLEAPSTPMLLFLLVGLCS